MREIVEREWEHGERAVLARQLNATGGDGMPGVICEQVGGYAPGQPRPADTWRLALALVAKRGECALESWRTGGVAVGEPNRQPIEQQVHRARSPWSRWCRASRVGGLEHARAEPGGDARGSRRLQMGIAGEAWVDRFEPPGCVEQERQRVCGAPQIQEDLAVETLQLGAVDLVERPGVRGREQRQRGLAVSGQLLSWRPPRAPGVPAVPALP